MHAPRTPQYNMHNCPAGWGWGGVGVLTLCQLEHAWTVWCAHGGGVGWAITFMSTWTRMDCMVCTWGWVGLGWGNNVHLNLNTCTRTSCYAPGSSLALAHICHATLWELLLHLRACVILHSGIFSCTCTHTSCYGLGSSLALAHIRHATVWDLLLHLHTYVMLHSGVFSCTCTHTSCYALGSSLALAHIRHATLWGLLLHLRACIILHSGIFSCTCTHTSCYGLGSSLALAHIRHATVWDLLLHLHTYVMLHSGVFSCTCTHTSCYALGSSLALAHIRHATHVTLLLYILYIHSKNNTIFMLPLDVDGLWIHRTGASFHAPLFFPMLWWCNFLVDVPEVRIPNICEPWHTGNDHWNEQFITIDYSTEPLLNPIQLLHSHVPNDIPHLMHS